MEDVVMIHKTVEGILQPDGKLALPAGELPSHPVRVMVTILEENEAAVLTDVGDYLDQLADYEERLARGEIQWQ
jgi:hypothetical protein